MSVVRAVLKAFLFRAALVAGLVALVGCAKGQADLSKPDDVASDAELTVCTSMPYEPFEFEEDGEVKGIDIDLVRQIGKDLGAEVAIEDFEFETLFEKLSSRECAIVASAVSITPEREEKFLFSNGYFEISQSLMVGSGSADSITTVKDLNGAKVGVQAGTTGADFVAGLGASIEIVEFTAEDEMIEALKASEIDAVVQDFPVNSFHASRSDDRLRVVQRFPELERERYGFVMNKDDPELRDAVNESLAKMKEDGRYDEILARYLGKAVDED